MKSTRTKSELEHPSISLISLKEAMLVKHWPVIPVVEMAAMVQSEIDPLCTHPLIVENHSTQQINIP